MASYRRTKVLLSIGVTFAAGIAFGVWQFSQPKSKAVAETTPKTVSSVHALGRLEPRGTVVRVSTPSGNEGACIVELKVVEGSDVVAGQVLATLDTFERRRCAVTEAEANATSARAKLAQIQAGMKLGEIAAAQASRDSANEHMRVLKRELDRAQKLFGSNAISEEEIDSRRWAYERGVHELHRFDGMLESAKEIRATDVVAQSTLVTAAEAAIATAVSNLDATRVLAPLDSRVLKIHAWPGEKPNDQGLCDVGCVHKMQAVAEVYEGDIALIAIGHRAKILLETSGKELDGTVVEIGQMVARKVVLTNDPVSDTDARVVEVRVDISPDQIQEVARLSNARVQVHFTNPNDPSTLVKLASHRE